MPSRDDAPRATPSLRLIGALAVAVLVLAVLGYWQTGSPSLARTGLDGSGAPAAAAPAAPGASGASAMEQIAAMVDQLAERMKQQPDDAKGWTMLARSYTVLGRFGDALPAYRRAIELVPNNASLLADYADAVAATKGSANNPESESLVERALRLEPKPHQGARARRHHCLRSRRLRRRDRTLAEDRRPGAGRERARAEGAGEHRRGPRSHRRRDGAGAGAGVGGTRRWRKQPGRRGQGQRHGHAGAGAARAGRRPTTPCSCSPARSAAACRSRCGAPRSPTCR